MPDPLAVLAALPADADLVVVRDGPRWLAGIRPEHVLTASGPDAFAILERLGEGWWAGFLTYDLGRSVERVRPRTRDDLGFPDLLFARFDARLVLEPSGAKAWVEGDGATRGELVATVQRAGAAPPTSPEPALGPWSSSLSRDEFESRVRAIVELIAAGDCYQVNLTRRLTCERQVDALLLFLALTRHNPAPHAALVRIGDLAVVSASPERFLRREGDRVETRPVKGTGTDEAALRASAKDRAENVMIVDLARNDLGRVAAFGTVAVPELCGVERHPGLLHLVSTVRATLRPGLGTGALVRATFPPASVTGAPKPRVLQAIEDLEPVRRGVYCGAVGWVDADQQTVDLNVAIRTFTMAQGCTHLGVGGGIVADSQPSAEWDETRLKASRLLAAAGAGALAGSRR